jgi:hypothetical protein
MRFRMFDTAWLSFCISLFSSDTDAGRSIGGFSRYLFLLFKRLAAWFPYLLVSRPKSALA